MLLINQLTTLLTCVISEHGKPSHNPRTIQSSLPAGHRSYASCSPAQDENFASPFHYLVGNERGQPQMVKVLLDVAEANGQMNAALRALNKQRIKRPPLPPDPAGR